jgi:3-phosphoshikimate 1-carboxyvinyltransferase
VASAQVKSAILLAGLYAEGTTKISEPLKTRDHSERMLSLYKADIKIKNNFIAIKGNKNLLSPSTIYIPADISSAAFFMIAAAILPDSKIIIENVSLNPSRMGIIRVLKRMGADIKFRVPACPAGRQSLESRVQHEPMGDIIVKSSILKGARVSAKEIPSLIDELPILMVAACFARGKTVLEGVQELRVKETDRIRAMSDNLHKMGAKIKALKHSGSEIIVVDGVAKLRGRKVRSFGDHRTAMSMIIAGLKAEGSTLIDDVSCIDKSFPEFLTILKPLVRF